MELPAAEVNILSLEVDFDYEFDASRYFNFVREETPSEAWVAESWFETAGSYPPSPFISKLFLEKDVFAETVNIIPKFKDTQMSGFHPNGAGDQVLYDLDEISKVLTVENFVLHDPYQNEKRFVFGSSAQVSTLMKPTASHLAKQNNHCLVRHAHQSAHRSRKPLIAERVKNSEDPSDNGFQAAKRQKLEDGLLRKIATEKQQIDLMHKLPKNSNKTSTSKLRLTIPREPELATAQRAQRIRVHRFRLCYTSSGYTAYLAFRSNLDKKSQEKTPAKSKFNSHPLNRKILEAPTVPSCRNSTPSLQEFKILEAPSMPSCLKSTPRLREFKNFKLKSSERDIKHSAATSSSLSANNHAPGSSSEHGVKSNLKCFQRHSSIVSRSVLDNQRFYNDENIQPKFTARPLNKKILSSRGDIGVFRCSKRETTKPMEFNLSTNKRSQLDLPTELFNKLSLNSEVPQSSKSLATPLWPLHGYTKDLKGNLKYIAQQGHKASYEDQGNLLRHEAKLFGFENEAYSYKRLEANNMR
ncbi:protein TPX2-like [Phalaenopsis equestris]|uniref:protein TPX2-like n=1 Tax=Phalaenopsis equestris TaxID=78828 RepID=UPI0009E3C662|nr:protein TPX2-like [Phalaenopsis equestris]